MELLRKRLSRGVATLFPGYFALVMATGIVSIAAHMLSMTAIAWTLYVLNIIFAVLLCVLLAARLLFHFRRVLADLDTHARGPGFFTLVAAFCVLGVQMVLLQDDAVVATILWFLAAFFWLVLLYAFFAAIVVLDPKPDLGHGLSGAWLLVVVSTEALSLLAILLTTRLPGAHPVLQFGALVAFLLGAVLFIFITALVFYRFTFFALAARDFSPLYWVNMGAAAITSLAGTTLVLNDQHAPFLQQMASPLILASLAYWVAGSWWIPLLIILGFWRHLVKHYPLAYTPRYWGIVFPLGMYTAATLQLANTSGFEFLVDISRFSIYVALAAWLVTAVGMLRHVASELFVGAPPAPLTHHRLRRTIRHAHGAGHHHRRAN